MVINLEKNGVEIELMFNELYLRIDVEPTLNTIVFDAKQSESVCNDVLKNVKRLQANFENDLKNEKNLECTYVDVASRLVGYLLHAVGYVIKSTL